MPVLSAYTRTYTEEDGAQDNSLGDSCFQNRFDVIQCLPPFKYESNHDSDHFEKLNIKSFEIKVL